MLINKGIKSKPLSLSLSNQPKAIRLIWTQIADPQRSTFNIYWYPTSTDATNDTNGILIASDVTGLVYDDNGKAVNGRSDLTLNVTYGYRIASVDRFGNVSAKSDPATIAYRAVGSADIDDAAITAIKIADAILTAAKFASTLQPVENFATLAAAGTATPAGRIIFVAADSKLYKAVGGNWAPIVNASDLSGQLTNAQIAALDAAKLTGTLDVARIAANALDATKFATSIRPVEIFATLAAAGTATAGRIIYVTADNKIYRGNGTSWIASTAAADITGALTDAQLAAIAASKITGQIVGTQITDGSITTPKMTANTIDGAVITGNTMNANKILSGSITTLQFTADTINGNIISTGTLNADKIVSGSITAGQIQAGAIGATEIAANSIGVKQLIVSDWTNLFLNPQFAVNGVSSIDGWTRSSGTVSSVLKTGATAPISTSPTQYMGQLSSTASATDLIGIDPIAVQPTDTFFYEFDYAAASGTTGTLVGIFKLTNASGGITTTVLSSVSASTTWQTFVGELVVPAGTTKISVGVRTTGGGTGNWYVTNFRFNRKGTGELIVDGAITTSKMTANTIDGAVITGNTMNASKILSGSITTLQFTADTINGNIISTGTLNADKIIAGTIQAAQIASGAISASKLFIGDTSNIFPDPEFADTGSFAASAGTLTREDNNSGGVSRYKMTHSAVTSAAVLYGPNFPVEANDKYYIEGTYGADNSVSAAYTFQIDWYSMSTAGVLSFISSTTIGTYTGTTAQNASIQVTAPATARKAQISFRKAASGSAAKMMGANVIVRRAITGELVVDGSITAIKMNVSDLSAISANLGTIVVGSANIMDSAILPSKFYQRDFSNSLIDPDFVQATSYWGPYSGTGAVSRVVANVGMMPESEYAVQATASGTTAGVITTTKQSVIPNRMYAFSAVIGPGTTSVSATVTIKVKWYQERNGTVTGPFGGVEHPVATKTENTGTTGLIRIAGNIVVPSGQNRVEVICECTMASGPVTITVGNVSIKKLGTVSTSVSTTASTGTFGTGAQVIETLYMASGYMLSQVAVWGAFRNRSGAAKTFDVWLSADGGVGTFSTFQSQKINDDEYAFVFGTFNPADNQYYFNVQLNVQSTTTGNVVSHTKMLATVDTGQ